MSHGTSPHARKLASLSPIDRLAYASKATELALCLLLISGVVLWDVLGVPWPLARLALGVHGVLAVLFIPLVLLPFWLTHRRFLKTSTKRLLRWTGRAIEIGLIGLILSGLWLAFFGNPGDLKGEIAHYIHLIIGLGFGALVVFHTWRFSIVRSAAWMTVLILILALFAAPALADDAGPPPAAVSSGSLVGNADASLLYSANFDAGSVSAIDRATGKRLAEVRLGGDIQRLALSPTLIAATDQSEGKVFLLDRASLAVRQTVAVPGRPWGVVYDARNHLFWVAAFEAGRLVGVGEDGTIKADIPVAETPRGLALMADGRLLVTQSLIGVVSVWDTTHLPLKKIRDITLVSSSDPTPSVSQGLPRVLDTIAVSPDGTEAWLPHLLWNFSHPFQFQSTVFPAVSILALTPGDEHEVPQWRKQLFKQINIIEDGNLTRIVSNPVDARFSADGKRVYVTCAGSEDLLVFDRSRAMSLEREEKLRKVGKGGSDQGAKAVQIFRHLPGANPRGLVVAGDDIYVQNAMSLDMTHLSRGGDGSFASVSVKEPMFATLVASDPLPAPLRRGERIFNLGNTSVFKDAPLAGDNWMSCQSCHVDGFIFTNHALFRDTPLDTSKNAIPGHQILKGMVAGDFIGDYIRMVKDTQGGMGADTRFGTPVTDPDKPSEEVARRMGDLHTYVTAAGNLPYLATWLRIDGGRLHPSDWMNPAACRECHSAIFDQWADSNHRLMGQSNPYYKAVEDLAGKTEGEAFRGWCLGCHQQEGVSLGMTRPQGVSHMLEKGGASLRADPHTPMLDEGTNCLSCHRITRVEQAGATGGGNASFTINLPARSTYSFENTGFATLDWLAHREINAKPAEHAASYSQPFYDGVETCGACHGEFAPGTGSVIVDTVGEWKASPFNRPDDPSKNRTCLDCHMHADVTRIGQPIPGRSTDNGPMKADVRTHGFIGAQYHLLGLRNPQMADQSKALLGLAAKLSASVDAQGQLVVRVSNVGAGHALPTGVSDFREMWLMLTVTDASGKVVLDQGHLTADGAVPADARLFHKVFGDADGKPVGLRFWRYSKLLADTRIPAGGYRDEAFALPPGTVWPVKADIKLEFRTYPQAITDIVKAQAPGLTDPETVTMTALDTTVTKP